MTQVLVVGSWHLGSVVGCCLAEAHNNVYLWDQSDSVKNAWQTGTPPIHEPGLNDLAKKYWGSSLFWATDFDNTCKQSDWIVVSYDTPIDEKDNVLLATVEEGLDKVLSAGIKNTTNFFLTAQLPVGTSRSFLKKLKSKFPTWNGQVLYQPENLRLGEAINCFLNPDRAVLGLQSSDKSTWPEVEKSFRKLTNNSKTPLNLMTLESAEMVKHALNSFLGTCVVFANEISEVCERSGADAWDVMASLKQDSRVGPKAFLRPGLGFAGGTLARDVKTLSKLTPKSSDQNIFSRLYDINASRNDWIITNLKNHLNGNLENRKIVLLGVTYKPLTSTVRRSPAIEIGQLLKTSGAKVTAIDPMADLNELTPQEQSSLPFELLRDWEQALAGADGAVLVTEWPQFLEIHWETVSKQMKHPIIIDTKNHFSKMKFDKSAKVIIPGKPSEKI